MKSSKGLTIVELVVVLAVIGIFISIGVGPMFGWISHYRFEAAGRSFVNAAQSVRIQAISGLPGFKVRPAPAVGIQGSLDNKSFRVFLDSVTFTCNTCGTVSDRKPTSEELPIKVGDYVELAGFNQPDYLYGNLFRITALNPNPPAVDKATPEKDEFGHLRWRITSSPFSIDCESCRDDDASNCVKWTDAASTTYTLNTGKVQVAACLKFLPNTDLPVSQRVPYAVIKNKTGSSVECYYDPDYYEVEVAVRKPDGTYLDMATPTIVFDFAGATRNHAEYTVSIRKKKKGAVDPKTHALNFHIDSAGRIKLGL
ncbi:MAG: prepilin-type N-terminal cleavage/methylation domain-containing protein [Desulfomonile tiedjei]|nr:prepilin-type N-terminal cleavage/methylation domain-containing protein [Desulfomonile tiedjei]